MLYPGCGRRLRLPVLLSLYLRLPASTRANPAAATIRAAGSGAAVGVGVTGTVVSTPVGVAVTGAEVVDEVVGTVVRGGVDVVVTVGV